MPEPVTYDGVLYRPDYKGRFFCPNACSDPRYPSRSWVSTKGFIKHMSECSPIRPVESIEPPDAAEFFGHCSDCGSDILKMSSIWQMSGRIICLDCYHDGMEGYVDCAGMPLPGVTLFG